MLTETSSELPVIGAKDAKIKILVCTNVLTQVDSTVYADHIHHYHKWGESGKYKFYLYCPRRQSIDRCRNLAAKYALELECDYLFFIDDDMLIHANTLESLIAADMDIVMADTVIRGYPFHRMAFKATVDKDNNYDLKNYDDLMEHRDSNGLVECAAIGFATCLLKTKLLKDLNAPYFCTTPNGTEDVYFCIRCRQELPYEVKIGVDTKVPTWHQMDPLFVGPENVDKFKKFWEQCIQEGVSGERDRGKEYYEKCKNL